MKILVLGSGAREHALVYSLSHSPSVLKIFACPGNAGMREMATCRPFRDNAELASFARENVDLAVIGSSRYVSEGTVDALVRVGVPVIGPAADAGRIETSKAFASAFMIKHGIPAPLTHVVVNKREAEKFLEENPWVRVVKADGFSRGSGVAVVDSIDEAWQAIRLLFETAGPPIILQERLTGPECSYTILTDGTQWISFSSCRDYKRAFEGESGPTTGGLGAVSPSPELTPELEERIKQRIVVPTVAGMHSDKLLYRGFLSFQLMLTSTGPKVLEFNARLGDPEAQCILTRFRGNLAQLLMDCALGRLDATGSEVAFGKHGAVSVVIARAGYPVDEQLEPQIENIEDVKDSIVFYASSEMGPNGKYLFHSGRLITLSALGETLADARKTVYCDIDKLYLKNVYFRRDIGS